LGQIDYLDRRLRAKQSGVEQTQNGEGTLMQHAAAKRPFRVGIDIGGTFTDFSLVDDRGGQLFTGKTLTVASDPARGVIEGMKKVLDESRTTPAEIGVVVHATTLVANSLIERKGAVTGLLTTQGFTDVVEIGRELRYDLYDLFLRFPQPLASRRRRLGVKERLAADGSVVVPLDEADLAQRARELVSNEGVESLAVCFIHSFRHPAHEERAKEILEKLFPGLPVSISSDVSREIREVERTSTTLANAFVKPLVSQYLQRLSKGFREMGVQPEIFVMLSNGGFTSIATASKYPIQLVESGPAAGVLVAAFYARRLGEKRAIAFDMGGTTAKAAVVRDGRPLVMYESEVAREHRFKKGSGIPLQVPVIDLIEAGAGGGSIAWLDSFGLLKVGPQSASSEPGPACYGLGGTAPTVTDADLILGYLNPKYFLGGRMLLDVAAARAAIARDVGEPLKISEIEAAWGILDLVNENMAAFMRTYLAERGEDPREFALVCTGGAGPVHAFHVARKLRISRIICPLGAGVASSLGLLTSPPALERVTSEWVQLGKVDWARINGIYASMEGNLAPALREMGYSDDELEVVRSADVRFIGQGYQMLVPVPGGSLDAEAGRNIAAAFDDMFKSRYGRLPMHAVGHEVLNWRVLVRGPRPNLNLRPVTPGGKEQALKGRREAYFGPGWGAIQTPVYDRYRLKSRDRFDGPALIEERESTIVVGPHSQVEVQEQGELLITLGAV
jgi:N-methylhydantoinase A